MATATATATAMTEPTATELTSLGVGAALDLLRRGEISASELTEAHLARIADPAMPPHTHISIDADGARAAAHALDQLPAQRRGALHGIPWGCKDLFHAAGLATTAGSRVLASEPPASSDAHSVARLRAAGAVLLGKHNLHEFAYGANGENAFTGTVPNPCDHSRLAGGSSSGSAAAVACGQAMFALGTDTGGSVRAPAALCGVVGFKPSRGRISTRGVIPYSWTLDHVGILTRSVADAALILRELAGFDAEDPASAEQPVADYPAALLTGDAGRGLRVGVPRDFFFDAVDAQILAASEAAMATLAAAGAELVDVQMPDLQHSRDVSLSVQMPEALSYHSRYLPARRALYGEDFGAGLAVGQFILAESYVRALRMIGRYRRQMAAIFDSVDLLITPAVPCVAPPIGSTHIELGGRSLPVGNALTRNTSFFNMSGNPAISIPAGRHDSGLPMAVQLVAAPFAEARLLAAARLLHD